MPLQQFRVFIKTAAFLTDEDCAFFETHFKLRTVKAEEPFTTPGKVCREIGFINKGAFRTYYIVGGKEINTCFFFENDFVVDYDSFLDEKPGKYYIEALEDAEILVFTADVLRDAYRVSHNWERFGRLMAEQTYKMTTERVESFLFMSGEERYLQLQQTQPKLFERLPLYHIASYIGLERETISRLRKKIAQG